MGLVNPITRLHAAIYAPNQQIRPMCHIPTYAVTVVGISNHFQLPYLAVMFTHFGKRAVV